MAEWGAPGLGLGCAQVVDPKLAVPRGAEASAGAMQRDEDEGDADIRLDDGLPMHYYPGAEEEHVPRASTSQAIDSSNKGFQLLAKMGWKGQGLGRNEDGIVEPVKAGVDTSVRLGLGKQEEDDEFTNPENITRKKLESEVQANETEERKQRREMQAEREERIKEDVTEMLRTFFCQICTKQYKNAREMEEHLSSYDHHHRKRMAETKAMMSERTKDERQRREQRRQEKETARLNEQFMRAQQGAQGGSTAKPAPSASASAPPPLPPGAPPPVPSSSGAEDAPPPPPPPAGDALPEQRSAIQFGMTIKMGGRGAGRGAAGGRGRFGGGAFGGTKRPATMAPAAAARPAKQLAPAAFGDDSDEEEAAA